MTEDNKRNRESNKHYLRIFSQRRSKNKQNGFKGDDEYIKGMEALERRDSASAVKHFEIAAKRGNAEAQCALAYCFEQGEGVKQDLLSAIKWWRKSAEQGISIGQLQLARYYENGTGIKQDMSKANKWYRKAANSLCIEAKQGDVNAQFLFGALCRDGKGVEKDLNEWVKWCQKSAEQGKDEAQYELGTIYLNGLCVKRNVFKAFKWFKVLDLQP